MSSATSVTVICKPTHYVIGYFGQEYQQLIKTADTNLLSEVYGIVLKVLAPPQYAGQVLTMHHDGVLATGNPIWWQLRLAESCGSDIALVRFVPVDEKAGFVRAMTILVDNH